MKINHSRIGGFVRVDDGAFWWFDNFLRSLPLQAGDLASRSYDHFDTRSSGVTVTILARSIQLVLG